MERRTSLMVARDILVVATGGSPKTPLVYKCNLNFKLIKIWLTRLVSRGLLDYQEGPPRTWKTTPKGYRFISAMEEVKAIWDQGDRSQEGNELGVTLHA